MAVTTAGSWLACREDILAALDVAATSLNTAQIDRVIEGASRGVEQFLHRRFAPVTDTRYFDWPNVQMGRSYRLWVDGNELISVSSLLSGASVIAEGNYFLEPADYGPPYNRLEINLGTTSAFDIGNTYQRNIAISGLFGYCDDETPVGTTADLFNATDDLVTIADGVRAGVGSILHVDDERMLLLDRLMVDTAGQTVGALTASAANTSVGFTGATVYTGETVQVDSEQMYVVAVTGSTLTVKRAWNGTILATHSDDTDIYASRQFRVQRGALGTTAEPHQVGTVWSAWLVPGPVRDLTVAEALNRFEQEQSGYARTVGGGDSARNASGGGLADLRASVMQSHGRQMRVASV